MGDQGVVAHPNTIRGPIEAEYNALREGIESQFVEDRQALEAARVADLAANAAAKSAALVAAGLNEDGSVPPTYPETADPENTVAPTITGTAQVGEELTVDEGTWTFRPDFTYQWERADSDETGNVEIEGATESTYTLVDADEGNLIRVKVTGTNPQGHHHAYSDYTTEVLPANPVNTELPTITGTAQVGQELTADDGTWEGEDTIVRQWERADPDGSNAEDIVTGGNSEQGPTYTLAETELGKKVRVIVSARNDGGVTTVESAYTDTVIAD